MIGVRERFITEPAGPSADAIAESPLLTIIDLLGLGRPKYQWLGDSATDIVSGEVLTPQSGALVNQAALGLREDSSLATASYRFSAASMDALDASGPTVADFDQTLLGFVVMRTATTPAAQYGILGKRDSVLNTGFELGMQLTGVPVFTADVGPSSAARQLVNDLSNDQWHAVGFLVDNRPGQNVIHLATEEEPGTPGAMPAGSISNTATFAIGQQRLQAAANDVALVVLYDTFPEGYSPHDGCMILAQNVFMLPAYERIPD